MPGADYELVIACMWDARDRAARAVAVLENLDAPPHLIEAVERSRVELAETAERLTVRVAAAAKPPDAVTSRHACCAERDDPASARRVRRALARLRGWGSARRLRFLNELSLATGRIGERPEPSSKIEPPRD